MLKKTKTKSGILRPYSNFNTVWTTNSVTNIDDLVYAPYVDLLDGNYIEAVAADSGETQQYYLSSIAYSTDLKLDKVTKMTVYIYGSSDSTRTVGVTPVLNSLNGTFLTTWNLDLTSTPQWFSQEFTGDWTYAINVSHYGFSDFGEPFATNFATPDHNPPTPTTTFGCRIQLQAPTLTGGEFIRIQAMYVEIEGPIPPPRAKVYDLDSAGAWYDNTPPDIVADDFSPTNVRNYFYEYEHYNDGVHRGYIMYDLVQKCFTDNIGTQEFYVDLPLTTLKVVDSIKVNILGLNWDKGNTADPVKVRLFLNGSWTSQENIMTEVTTGTIIPAVYESNRWYSHTFTGPWNYDEIQDLKIELESSGTYTGLLDGVNISSIYLDLIGDEYDTQNKSKPISPKLKTWHPINQSLEFAYLFNEVNGNVVKDYGHRKLHLTNPTAYDRLNWKIDDDFGPYVRSYGESNTSISRLNTDFTNIDTNGKFTLAGWFRPYAKNRLNGNDSFVFNLGTGVGFGFATTTYQDAFSINLNPTTYTYDKRYDTYEWIFAVVTYNEDTEELKLYLNGKEVYSTTHSTALPSLLDVSLTTIGNRTQPGNFIDISSYFGWNRVLTPNEVSSLYSDPYQMFHNDLAGDDLALLNLFNADFIYDVDDTGISITLDDSAGFGIGYNGFGEVIIDGESGFGIGYNGFGEVIIDGESGFGVGYNGFGEIVLDDSAGFGVGYNGFGEVIIDGESGFGIGYNGFGEVIIDGESGFGVGYNGDGEIVISGIALTQNDHEYNGVGEIIIDGESEIILDVDYLTSGEIIISGDAITSYIEAGLSYIASGEIQLSGISRSNYLNNTFIYSQSGLDKEFPCTCLMPNRIQKGLQGTKMKNVNNGNSTAYLPVNTACNQRLFEFGSSIRPKNRLKTSAKAIKKNINERLFEDKLCSPVVKYEILTEEDFRNS